MNLSLSSVKKNAQPSNQHVNAKAVQGECFAVVNKQSKRRLFAKRGGSGKTGFGAVADARDAL